ncbi:hypothetical protein L1049_024838 [Liquidambar formosana]|uniref:F-box domain-containing protein n=1 Tax=Liquidambar formosana TaxID=63359 RepID=A0AAP0X5F0_LIQFO
MAMEKGRLHSMLESLMQQHEEENSDNTRAMATSDKESNMTEEKTGASDEEDRISKLPHHVVMDIFCKLPIKSLMYCRCVCKAWRDLVLDPCFATQHLTTRPPTTILTLQCDGERKRNIYMVEPEASDLDAITKVKIPNLGIQIVGSCNGLLCLCAEQNSHHCFYILNPFTGECMTLPKIKTDPKHTSVSGFGFSSKTNQYKVIRISCRWEPGSSSTKAEAEIYTVGSGGSWREIGYAPDYYFLGGYAIFLNGALYWIVDGGIGEHFRELVCAFDIGNEQFLKIPLPVSYFSEQHGFWTNIGVLEGRLYVCGAYSGVEIWVMNDNGVEESWTKEVVLQNVRVQPFSQHSWAQLIGHSEGTLFFCGCERRSRIDVFPLIASFLSLDDILMGASSEVLNVHSM